MAKEKTDDLADVLADMLNKENKDGGKIAFKLEDNDDPSAIVDWLSTGSSLLDLAISNRPNGGIPCGRITEVTGLEASGKSLLAAHCLAETQKKGGIAVFIDTESAVSPDFLKAIGVDISKMLYVQSDTVEDIFENIEKIVSKVRQSNKDRLVTIVVDSVAGASCKTEMESEHGKDGYATGKAIIISKAMRKITGMIARQRVAMIFTNQLRQKLGVMFGDPWTTSGGKALAFHSSVRLRLKAVGQIKKKGTLGDEVVGIKTKAIVIKNRLGPPMRIAEFNILFDRGIANYEGWLEVMKTAGIVAGAKSPYTYSADNGEKIKLDVKELVKVLNERPEIKEELYKKICDVVIMKYKDPNAAIDEDVEVSNDTEGLEE